MKLFNFRTAILLIHGFAGGNYDYGKLGNDLEQYRNFDIYTFTLPGHDKILIHNVTKDDWINSAEKELEKLIDSGYKKIYVIGHSMGGVIASHLANKYKKVKKLVLAAPAFEYFKFENDKLNIIESIKTVPKLFTEYNTGEIIERVIKSPTSTIKEFMSLVKEHKKDITTITCPTLIIHGTKDKIVPTSSVDYVYDNINSKSVTLYQIKGLNHNLFINDRYEEVLLIIKNFLRNKQKNIKEKKEI